MKSPQFLAQFPPKKPRRYQWSTRRTPSLTPEARAHLDRDRQVFPIVEFNGHSTEITSKASGVYRPKRDRHQFYRFNTKPNWGAHAAVNRAAFLLLQGSR